MIQATPTGHKKREALARLQENALHEAKACLIEVCEADTNDADAWFWLAEVNGRLGLSAEAEVCSRRAIALQPRHADAHVALGLALEYQGNLRDAAPSFQRGIELDPRHETAIEHFTRINLHLSAGNTLTLNITGGIEICLPDSLQLMTPYVLLEQEDWFEDEIRFVRSLVRPGMQAVDIGANYGV